ncbi:MAG: DUF2207 domain-containing protein [Verrucomicrobiota bacterium]
MLLISSSLNGGVRSESVHASHEGQRERLRDLSVLVRVKEDGSMRVEQQFSLAVHGGTVRRGPSLSYLTVFKGPGALILDNGFEVESVRRNGIDEPFRVIDEGGISKLVIGSKDVFLEHAEHHYEISYRAEGDWRYTPGEVSAFFDVLFPFELFHVESVRFELELPEGTSLLYHTPVIGLSESPKGSTDHRSTTSTEGLIVETTAPIRAGGFFYVNVSWSNESVIHPSRWIMVVRQHPRLALSAFVAAVLLLALIELFLQILQRHRHPRPLPASAEAQG